MVCNLNATLGEVLLKLHDILLVNDRCIDYQRFLLLTQQVRCSHDVGRTAIEIYPLLDFNRDMLPHSRLNLTFQLLFMS